MVSVKNSVGSAEYAAVVLIEVPELTLSVVNQND